MTDEPLIDQALRKRRSIRDFTDRPVPDALIDDILTAALEAPSWGNTQPYRVAVAQGAVARDLGAELHQLYTGGTRFASASALGKLRMLMSGVRRPDGDFNTQIDYPDELKQRYRETGKGLYGVLGIKRGDAEARIAQMGKNFTFFGAPCALFVFCEQSLGVYSALDAGAFIQSLALAAEARGLGTCIQAALATWANPVKARFDIPDGYKLLCGVALGFPSDAAVNSYAPTRRRLAELVLSPKENVRK